MRDKFTEAEPGVGWNLIYVLALLACLLAIAWLFNRWQQRRANSQVLEPMSLYLRVQRKLGLSPLDQWRLWRLAKVSRAEHPAALLISARMYDEAVRQYCSARGRLGDRSGAAPHFASIRSRLFRR